MTANSVVRARIDEQINKEAAAVLAAMGLTVSDAFRLMMVKIAPGLVHRVLRFRCRIVTAASAERRQEALHRAPVRQRRCGAGLRRGFRSCFRARLLRD